MTQLLVAVLRVWCSIVKHVILLTARPNALVGSCSECVMHAILLTVRNDSVNDSCTESVVFDCEAHAITNLPQ